MGTSRRLFAGGASVGYTVPVSGTTATDAHGNLVGIVAEAIVE